MPVMEAVKRVNHNPPERTKANQRAFLEALSKCGNKKRACLEVGIDDSSPYMWANRSERFAEKMAEAQLKGEKVQLDEYEQLLHKRISAGTRDPHSAVLTMFRMKRLDPRYRDNATMNVVAAGPVAIMMGMEQPGEPQDVVVEPRQKAIDGAK